VPDCGVFLYNLYRQTRMLADLALVGCYNTSYMPSHAERNRVMLASAKRNLAAMAFFGLTEYQKVVKCAIVCLMYSF
jgi:hypothetical protein